MNVVVAGGGTAGHIEPALALADALVSRHPSAVVTAVGTERGLETRLVPARGYELDLIPAVPLPRRLTADLFRVPSRLWRAVRAARKVLERRQADVVVGFGGYVALPVYLAARRGVPVVVHEANARAGLANRVGARFARATATSYASTRLPRSRVTGIPLRRAIATLDREALRAEARRELGLDAHGPVLLVFGGSQGARRINEAVTGAARALADAGVQVLHATGTGQFDGVVAALAGSGLDGSSAPYRALPYIDRMDYAYAAADLVLCRSGAMTCAELTAVGLPAVFVPLPHGNGEQRLNAADIVNDGGAVLVDDAALDLRYIAAVVLPLLLDAARLEEMSLRAAGWGRRDAAERLADLVDSVLAAGAA